MIVIPCQLCLTMLHRHKYLESTREFYYDEITELNRRSALSGRVCNYARLSN